MTSTTTRRLERSRGERWLFGVCGGLARYFDIDPVIVRLAAIALVFFGGVSIVAYVVALLVVPEEGGEPLLRTVAQAGRRDRPWIIAGIALIVLAAIASVDALDGFDGGDATFALVLAGVGAWLIVRHTDRGRARASLAAPAPAPSAPGALALRGETAVAPHAAGPPETAETAELPPSGPPPPEPPRRRRRRRRATGIALGAVLLIVGLGGFLLAAGAYDVAIETFVAASIVVTGVALLVASFFDGAPLLIWLGFGTAVLLGTVTAAGLDLDGGVGDRLYEPSTAAEVRPQYELGVGRLWVDLRGTPLPPGQTVIDAELGVGELTVVVPDGVQVRARGQVALGETHLLGAHREGAEIDVTRIAGPPRATRTVVIDGDLGVGELRVYRASEAPDPDGELRGGTQDD